MDKTIRRYTDFEELKADEFRYWQSRPVHEPLDAVEEMIHPLPVRPIPRPGGSGEPGSLKPHVRPNAERDAVYAF